MAVEQIIIGVVTAAFAGGGAWAGTQIRIKSIERRVEKIEKREGIVVNRFVRLITKHNACCEDNIDTNGIVS